jgi:tetratricopeptide (TPR) repeat protein
MSLALSQYFSETGHNVIHVCVMQAYVARSYAVPQLLLDIALRVVQRSAMVLHADSVEMLREAARFRSMCEGPAIQQSVPRLISFLRSLVRLLPELVLVVDDLHLLACDHDDPERRIPLDVRSFMLWLQGISQQRKTSVLIFSCHRRWLQNSLEPGEKIQISADMTNADIAIVFQQWLENHPNWKQFSDYMKPIILEKAEGNFEWLSLVLEELGTARMRSEADLKRQLSQMPSALHEVYMRKSALKLQTLNERESVRRERILQIMAAAERPLHVECINEGSSFDPFQQDFVQDDRFFAPAQSIQEICEPFLEVHEDYVHFRHESARQSVLKEVINITDANSFLLDICLSKLTEPPFMQLKYCARLLEDNLLVQLNKTCAKSALAGESGLYTHAALHWHEYAIALRELTPVLWNKMCTLLNSNAFVSWSENLCILKQRNGLNAQFSVGTAIIDWYNKLGDGDKSNIGIENYLIAPYESISDELRQDEALSTLHFLALIRPGHYLNLSGRTDADFEKALSFKKRVAEGFDRALGPRDRNTLLARRTYDQELQGFDRHDEALKDYLKILKIQQEDLGEDVIDMYETLQWIGVAYQAMTNFGLSRNSLRQAIEGYRRIKGEADFAYLIVTMFLGFTVEAQGDLKEAARLYGEIYDKWIPVNGNSNPFAAAILTARGSLLRKEGKYARAQEFLFEAFGTRIRLFSITNQLTFDSGLQLAVLYRQKGETESAEGFLKQIHDSVALGTSYERRCQVLHIEALLAFDAGGYEEPRNTLMDLILQSVGEQRDRNNRELLWVRLNLAEALRVNGQSEEAPNLFDEIVTPIESPSRRSSCSGWSNISDPSQEVVIDTPRDLKIAERALRLVRDGSADVAAELLAAENLRWVRTKDFWIISGGPKVDTDSVRFVLPGANEEADENVGKGGCRPSRAEDE